MNRFSIYTSEEKSVLKLLEKLGNQVNGNSDLLKTKTDLYGDHKGTWQGLDRPTLSEEGMRATVEKHIEDIKNLQDKDVILQGNIDILEQQDKILNDSINLNKTTLENMKGNVVYMKDFPKTTTDYSKVLNPLTNTTKTTILVCDSETDYIFRTPLLIKGRLQVIGNGCTWKYIGSTGSKFINYVEAPWQTEGLTVEGVTFWCNEGNVAYQSVTGVNIEGNHINLKFRDCKWYNFGYTVVMNRTNNAFTFGHSFMDCSFWGFINAIKSDGNAEQVLIKHCWFDDGLRTDGSTNACIRLTDVSSFWVQDCIIQNCDIGISVRGGYNVSIRDNHFENMIDSSVYFYPASAYENRNCIVDSNFMVGGKCCVRFVGGTGGKKTIHCTFFNNFAHFIGDSGTHMFYSNSSGACDYSMFYNNTLRPEVQALGKNIINANTTNCGTGFQTP